LLSKYSFIPNVLCLKRLMKCKGEITYFSFLVQFRQKETRVLLYVTKFYRSFLKQLFSKDEYDGLTK